MGLLRFLLAISVVMYHSNGFFRYSIASGDAAVQVFFMISGFLMALVLGGKYSTAGGIKLFYANRLLRVYPSYVACLALTIIVSIFLYNWNSGYLFTLVKFADELNVPWFIYLFLSAVTIIGQEFILFFVPSATGLIFSGTHLGNDVYLLQPLPQAWSLSFELMFYLLAPAFARARTSRLLAVTACLLVLKLTVAGLGYTQDPIAHRFFPTSLPMFLLGMIAFRWRDILVPSPSAARRWGIGFLVASFLVSPMQFVSLRLGLSPEYVDSAYYIGALFAIPALFSLSNELKTPRARRWDTRLGELSYPIYICHLIVTGIVATLLPRPGIVWDAVRCAINVPATLPLAMALVIGIERPIERYRAERARLHKARLSEADIVDIAFPV